MIWAAVLIKDPKLRKLGGKYDWKVISSSSFFKKCNYYEHEFEDNDDDYHDFEYDYEAEEEEPEEPEEQVEEEEY